MIEPQHDAMGQAIADFFRTGQAGRLRVFSSMFEEDEIPVSHLFRTFRQMPPLEQRAMELCRGRVLDVGAGAGCHALALQERGLAVTAIDISPLSCQVMRERGIRDVQQRDVMQSDWMEQYDTILLMMNGLGVAGTVDGLPLLLDRLRLMLNDGGQILADSSDLRYIYEDEDGQMDWDPADGYYGEVDFRMQYKRVKSRPFPWLYVDFQLLQHTASQCGLQCEMLCQGQHYDYLVRLAK